MLAEIKKYHKILVTGPQRSGTRIASKILSHELDYEYIDENEIGVNSLRLLIEKLTNPSPMVIHGPCFSSICHRLDFPDFCIVFMMRDVFEIKQSEIILNWRDISSYNYFYENGGEATVKYDIWEQYQKPNSDARYFEVQYESFSYSPLWKPKSSRVGFKVNQTS